jgi:glyoxylase-like metal-dependent hydrolase (beta-lactamase superfamily II)
MSTYLIDSIEGNRQRLDGGSMFGNVPRALWAGWIEPDERHRIELGCRAFLIRETDADTGSERRILLEAGIGVFFEPKLRDRYGVLEPEHRLLVNLERQSVVPEQIDVVVLSHLHFDHAGGILSAWSEQGAGPELVFPGARFVTSRPHWERAMKPHFRDRASFIPAMLELLQGSDRLELVAPGERSETLGPDFSFTFSDGHTPGLLLTELRGERGSVVFCGDLIPGRPWIHLPVTMGYDRYPELLIDEKRRLLQRCLEQGTRLLLTHDPVCASCAVKRDERGRFGPTDEQDELRGYRL